MNTQSRYLVQYSMFSPTLNSCGYPDGPKEWSGWRTRVDLEDRGRAERICHQLRNIRPLGLNQTQLDYHFKNEKWRVYDSVEKVVVYEPQIEVDNLTAV